MALKCEKELREKIEDIDKLRKSNMKEENFKTKDYIKNMKMNEAQTKFTIKTEMIDVKFNYKNVA